MTDFTTTKPTLVGTYQVRGWHVGKPRNQAVVSVERNGDGDLVCNLHESNSNVHVDEWDTLDQFADDFEWRGPMHLIMPNERKALDDLLRNYEKVFDTEDDPDFNVLTDLAQRLRGDGP